MLELPDGEYMVMGSGILGALGIRPARDADIVVSARVYEKLKELGWTERTYKSGSIEQIGLENGPFQVFYDWTDDDGVVKSVEELLESADIVEGVAYNSLDKLSAYKLRRGQDKDLRDLELINQFRDNHREVL